MDGERRFTANPRERILNHNTKRLGYSLKISDFFNLASCLTAQGVLILQSDLTRIEHGYHVGRVKEIRALTQNGTHAVIRTFEAIGRPSQAGCRRIIIWE